MDQDREDLIEVKGRIMGERLVLEGESPLFFEDLRVTVQMPKEALVRAKRRQVLYPFEIFLLKKETRLYAEVNFNRVPQELHKFIRQGKVELPGPPSKPLSNGFQADHSYGIWLVELVLMEDLWMRFRAPEDGSALLCKVRIPSLGTEVPSLNHAYTVVAQTFEPSRRSATGNVFERVYEYADGYMRKLAARRWEVEQEYVGVEWLNPGWPAERISSIRELIRTGRMPTLDQLIEAMPEMAD